MGTWEMANVWLITFSLILQRDQKYNIKNAENAKSAKQHNHSAVEQHMTFYFKHTSNAHQHNTSTETQHMKPKSQIKC